jgi:tetratricopeptide (TPR) repeat protein
MIGRAAETAQLKACHDRAVETGGVLLISGSTGVGKTRLLHEYLATVTGAGGPAVAVGRAVGIGGQGFGPFAAALRDLLAGQAVDLDGRRASLMGKLPELLAETPGLVEPMAGFILGERQPGPESGLSQDALFAATVEVFRGLAAERPVALVLEDLHLAGAETIDLFGHLARCVSGSAVFLVGTYSDEELEEDSSLGRLISRATGDEATENLVLSNLSVADTEELVRFLVGHERTVRAVGPALRTKSEGNPLIVLEALTHLRQTENLVERDSGLELEGELDEIAVPASVRDLLTLKLAGLDEEQRETLEVAAVIGFEFQASLLADVLGEEPIELLQRLARLERRHRLLESSGKSTFHFASRQLYEAVYESISPALRLEYHAVVADSLLEGEPSDSRTAYALLRHLHLAERTPEAAPFLEAALKHMAASFHATYAAPFLEKILEELAAASPHERFSVAMQLWSQYELLASREDQMRILDVAGPVSEEMDDAGSRAQIHALRAGSHWYAGEYDRAHEEAEAGLALAREAGDQKWESTCYHTLGVVAFRRGEFERCADLWRDALRIRSRIGDRRGEASTLQALSIVMPAIGEGEQVLATMQEAMAIWREIGERRGEASMLMNVGNHLVDVARYEEGLRHLELAIERHRETGARINEALALTNLGRAQHILGRIDDARASWELALQHFVDLGYPDGELAARAMLGSSIGAYGEREEAIAQLEAVIELADAKGDKSRRVEAHRELGELLHEGGERTEAWEHLDAALALEEELDNAHSRVATLGVAGKVALAEGDHERAGRLLSDALPDARGGKGEQAPLILSRLARALHGEGRDGEARELLVEVEERLSAGGRVSTLDGPEIYFTLSEVGEDELKARGFLSRARELVEERARQIRNDSYREHFLARRWPNAEILARSGSE